MGRLAFQPITRVAAAVVLWAVAAGLLPVAGYGVPIREADYQAAIKVACVGDSITFGAGLRDRDRESFPAQLGHFLGEGWNVRNFGVSARTMLRKGDYPYWQTQQFGQAAEFAPDVVIIKLGTNDTKPQNWAHKEEFATDYRDMVEHFRNLPSKPKLFLCCPVPAFPERWGIRDSVIREEVIPVVRAIAADTGSTCIDLYSPFVGKAELFPDKVHPNAEGSRRMAELIHVALTGRQPGPFPGRQSVWNGFDRHDFKMGGRATVVVTPKEAAPGRPWIWRARFFGHEPQTDVALLQRGFHLVYTDVANLYGAPVAVAQWDRVYEYLTREHGFARRPALEGMSRGGLIIFNWAAANPDKVACIYADAPVCDFKSWPKGHSAGDWQRCLAAYGLTAEQAAAYTGNPVDQLRPLAEADIPLLHICGAADTVVPVAENTAVIETRYKALGGRISVILKPGVGHHPHSLKDPTQIVDFVLANTVSPESRSCYRVRGDLHNSRLRFSRDREGRVAFLGGSITFMEGYRPRVCDMLKERYPGTRFDFVNAGISSTCSTTGAFRLEQDVFGGGPVDLLFVEFAVNDNQDAAHSRQACIRGMEGLVRHAKMLNPAIDIVLLYCVNESHRDAYLAGREPHEIAAHREVAAAYGLCEVNLAAEIAARIGAGEFDWKKFGGCHPSAFGNDLYAATIKRLFDRAARVPLAANAKPEPTPLPEPLDRFSYWRGHFADKAAVARGEGWELRVPAWSKLPGSKRGRFTSLPLLHSTKSGATATLEFNGTALGLYVLAGPDAGSIQCSVDGGAFRSVDLYHRFSKGLHYPRTAILADELEDKAHHAVLRVAPADKKRGRGTAVRILEICVN